MSGVAPVAAAGAVRFAGFRHWVATCTNCWLSTCVEFGYSRCGGVNSAEGMRELGANMLKAVARTARGAIEEERR